MKGLFNCQRGSDPQVNHCSKGRSVHFSGVWDSGPPINFPYKGGAVLIPTLFYSGENAVS